MLKVSRFLLLFLAVLLAMRPAEAAITGCIRSTYSGNQVDLATGKLSFISALSDTAPRYTLTKYQTTDGRWHLVVNGAQKGAISLQTKLADNLAEVGLIPETHPLYISVFISHPSSRTTTFEVWSLKSLKRLVSIADIKPPCEKCISWHVDRQRVAITTRIPSEDISSLWLIALDTGLVRKFDLTAIEKKYEQFSSELIEMAWSPDGRHLAWVSPAVDGFYGFSLFSLDGTYHAVIDNRGKERWGAEGYVYPPVVWAGDSRRFFFLRYLPPPDKDCTQECNAFQMVYLLESRQAKQFAQFPLGHSRISLNAAGTRALMTWQDEKGNHISVFDTQTGDKLWLADTYNGNGAPWVHWQDRGLTWIEDHVNKDYRITWMASETAKRHSVTFPGEYVDYGEPGLGNYARTADVIWNNQTIITYTASYSNNSLFSAWMIDTKSENVRRLAQENYRLRLMMSPDKTAFILLPDYIGSDWLSESLIKIVVRGKPDVELRLKPASNNAIWSPDSSMLVYTQLDGQFLHIVDRTGRELYQYKTQGRDFFGMEWIAKCLPGEPVSMEP